MSLIARSSILLVPIDSRVVKLSALSKVANLRWNDHFDSPFLTAILGPICASVDREADFSGALLVAIYST